MRTLQIIDTAYRATLEEQDDTTVWLTHALRGAGADLAVLLTGNAVNYAVEHASAAGLRIGSWQQKHPPRLAADLSSLIDKGVPVFVLLDDVAARAIPPAALIPRLQYIELSELGAFVASFQRVWRW